jgi:hypothetical protein
MLSPRRSRNLNVNLNVNRAMGFLFHVCRVSGELSRAQRQKLWHRKPSRPPNCTIVSNLPQVAQSMPVKPVVSNLGLPRVPPGPIPGVSPWVTQSLLQNWARDSVAVGEDSIEKVHELCAGTMSQKDHCERNVVFMVRSTGSVIIVERERH